MRTDMNRRAAFHNFTNPCKNPRSAHTLYLCVLCGSQYKQRLSSLYSINRLVFRRVRKISKTDYLPSLPVILRMTNAAEKIKTHILCSATIFFFEDRTEFEIMWANTVEWGRPQMTIWRMRIAC